MSSHEDKVGMPGPGKKSRRHASDEDACEGRGPPMSRRRPPIARDLPLKGTAAGSDRSTNRGVTAEGLRSTANRDRLAMIDRPSPSQPVSPLPAGHRIAVVRLDAASSRRRRTALARSQRGDRQLLPLELARQSVDFATTGQCELHNKLLE